MGELVEKQFPVKTLLTGLRAIGYSFSTAVADIIDNSVSAEADTVNIYFDPIADIPFFCILDNGRGMNFAELNNAMMPGSDRTNKEDSDLELGRFGLGLKSASLSQCREFIVASKKYGKINAMAFDLDVIEDCRLMHLMQREMIFTAISTQFYHLFLLQSKHITFSYYLILFCKEKYSAILIQET